MHRFLAVCVSVLVVCAAGCGEQKSLPAPSGGVSAKEFRALEARVAELEKKLSEAPKGGGGDLAALEAKLKAVAAATGVNIAEPLKTIGVLNTDKKAWKCVKAAAAPTVDGKLDDAAWKKAQQVNLVSDEAGKRIANETSVLICHDGEKLYIGAVCMESEMAKLHTPSTKRDDKVYRDDCIEF
ncbi:MAG: DOMON domain-containing protein, partial [Planctomycetota bacterium]